MQLFGLINQLLAMDRECFRRDLQVPRRARPGPARLGPSRHGGDNLYI